MHPSHPAVTTTRPHKWLELNALCQALFKILHSDLDIEGDAFAGFESGNFSSGHVGEPFNSESKKDARPKEKQSCKDEVFGCEFSLTSPFAKTLPGGSVPGLVLKPHHGIVTDAFWERKLSDDRTFFAWPVVPSSLL